MFALTRQSRLIPLWRRSRFVAALEMATRKGLPTVLQAAFSCCLRGRDDGCHQVPSLHSERVHHARSATAVNPLRGSSAPLRPSG